MTKKEGMCTFNLYGTGRLYVDTCSDEPFKVCLKKYINVTLPGWTFVIISKKRAHQLVTHPRLNTNRIISRTTVEPNTIDFDFIALITTTKSKDHTTIPNILQIIFKKKTQHLWPSSLNIVAKFARDRSVGNTALYSISFGNFWNTRL